MNPLNQSGNESQEAARARELAELVHKTKLGSHTDHKKDSKNLVFDTQKTSAFTSAAQPTQPLPTTPLQESAKVILGNAALIDPLLAKNKTLTKNILPEEPLQTAAEKQIAALDAEAKPLERIAPNQSLANQSAVLHTYTQDVESLVKDRKVSMVRAVALESDRDPQLAQFAQKTSSPSSTLTLLALICSIFALGIGAATFYIRSTQSTSPSQVPQTARYNSGLIFFEHTQPFDVTDLEHFELIGGLAHLRDTIPSSLGSFTVVDMYNTNFDPVANRRTAAPLLLPDFFSQSRFSAPDQLLRSLTGEYMLLIHQAERATPVLAMRAESPDAAFASMLVWEKSMTQNLSPLFPLGTLTLAETAPSFTDLSFSNIDARVLYDGDQNLLLVYALLERNVVVVTNSTNTLEEMATRLHTQRLKK